MAHGHFDLEMRISSEGECGTIKYIGELESQEGLWLGIEWDNPDRGKHSGTYKNVQYFKTSVPNAGSFIRARVANTGISCAKAIMNRYGELEDSEGSDTIIFPQNNSDCIRVAEMVGFEQVFSQQSNFHQLKDIAVSGMGVNSAGELNELKRLVPNVSFLDLSCNLLSTWSQVAEIVIQLPRLKSLVLSKNRLVAKTSADGNIDAFVHLQTLIMKNMSYTWKDVLTSAILWPHIEVLHVCLNQISLLEVPSFPVFSKLRCLDLDKNAIVNWEEVLKLGNITTLEELHLVSCQIKSVYFPDVLSMGKTNSFPNLSSLYIGENELSRWQDVAELNKLHKLKILRISNNPVVDPANIQTARQLVIAKISQLEILNQTVVEKCERRESEYDYLKKYYSEWLKNGGTRDPLTSQPREEFLTMHPTYPSILHRFGAPEETEIEHKIPLLKNTLLSIQIFSSQSPNQPSVIKKLPGTMTVNKVKALVQRLYKLPVGQDLKLMCLTKDKENRPGFELDNDMRQLSFYSLADGDKIDVQW